MKHNNIRQKSLKVSCLIILALALQGGCITVKDSQNRENQIKNASKSFVEAYMAKRILEKKATISDTYIHLYSLQDSIQKALLDVRTVEELKTTSIQSETQEVENLRKDLLAYIDYEENDEYSRRFGQILLSSDVQQGADELFRMIHIMRTGNYLPTDYQGLKDQAKARNTFIFNLQEFLNKRALTASQGYRNWADVYRQKGIELHESVLRDKRFTMTDLERIETERLAEQYLALSLEFTEKSDSLLAASKECRNPWKAEAEIQIQKHLRLKNLAYTY